MRRWIVHAFAALAFLLPAAAAALVDESFVVEDIRVEGVERLEVGTVLNYLPVRAGEDFSQEDARRAVRALYDTGLFRDVSLYREGDILVVEVDERPAITEINIDGDFSIEEEQLLDSLEQIGLARGRIFDRSVFSQINQVLREQMYSRGKYGMQLETEVRELDRDRVAIDITLREGKAARIRQINIIGNEAFSDEELKELMDSGIPGPLSLWSSADEYSRTQLEGDLENIRSHYLNRGYANFAIGSSQVTITPDRKEIYITINVDEGEQYTFGSVDIVGDLPVPKEELENQVLIQEGDTFSRQRLVETRTGIADRLSEEGYAFANINVTPRPDEDEQKVDIRFDVEPGKKVHVRRITFSGHVATQDIVYRRELRQFEGAQYSPSAVDRSRVRLQRLPQVQEVNVSTQRVSGRDDQIDIEFAISERPTGSLSIGAGVSSTEGVVFSFGFEQKNLLGTGRDLNLNVNTSQENRRFIIRYTNPYYTDWGMSRSLRVEYEETDPTRLIDTRNYFSDRMSIGFDYGVPISEYQTVDLGIGVEGRRIGTTDSTPGDILGYLDERGNEFAYLKSTVGYRHDSRNRTIFAESGSLHRTWLSVVLPGGDIEFAKTGYSFEGYASLTDNLVFSPSFRLDWGSGYAGDEDLPFFERFFAGGIRSVRGYAGGTLGPKFDNGDPSGGDLRTVGSLELVFPPPFSPESANTRLSAFYDFGTVFENADAYDVDELRTAVGVSFNWRSPIGPLSFSYAEALNPQEGDETETFQFTLGTLF